MAVKAALFNLLWAFYRRILPYRMPTDGGAGSQVWALNKDEQGLTAIARDIRAALTMIDVVAKETFEKQIGVEKGNARGLREAAGSVENVLLKELFRSIALDSEKHAGFYRAIVDYLSAPRKQLESREYAALRAAVEEHTRVEEKMIRFIEGLLAGEGVDRNVSYILTYILEDERRHHALLRGIMEAIAKKETAEFDEWWDTLWKIYGGKF